LTFYFFTLKKSFGERLLRSRLYSQGRLRDWLWDTGGARRTQCPWDPRIRGGDAVQRRSRRGVMSVFFRMTWGRMGLGLSVPKRAV